MAEALSEPMADRVLEAIMIEDVCEHQRGKLRLPPRCLLGFVPHVIPDRIASRYC
jgi:hypothetical protein